MKQTIILIFSYLMLGCSQPTITKESHEVAKISYAIKDSLNNARIDLADSYSDQLVQLIVPPKDSISILPIIKDGKRVAVIPNKYRDDNVVVVGTQEWSNLIKIKEVVVQLANDKTNLNAQLLKVQEEIREQQELKEKLAADNIILSKEISDCKYALLKRTLYLAGVLTLIAGYIYIKIQGIPASILSIAGKIPFLSKLI